MGVIKAGSKVMSALCKHSWCYSLESCFDAAQIFAQSWIHVVTDRADGRNTYRHIYLSQYLARPS